MFGDLWGWFDNARASALRTGDKDRQRVYQLYMTAWPYRETDPSRMLSYLTEGYEIASTLRDYCWMLFLNYWRCEVYLFYLYQVSVALDFCVKAAVEARKPEYEKFPIRERVYRILTDAYPAIPPLCYS